MGDPEQPSIPLGADLDIRKCFSSDRRTWVEFPMRGS
jgi:hypothetical protein